MVNFAKIKLIVVGKIKKSWIRDGLKVYLKRLPELVIKEIKDSTPIKEGKQVLSIVNKSDYLIILTDEGQHYTSLDFANFLNQMNSHNLVFVIGGSEGISQELKGQASWQLSLSPMTFPHEIARLLFIEQLYRAKTLLQGSHYHKF